MTIKHKLAPLSALAIAFLPLLAHAQTKKKLDDLIYTVIDYGNMIITLMMGVAVIMFIYYVIKYFIKADSEREKAAPYVMWSLIGFFVILSMWGLVNILQDTFGLRNEDNRPAVWQSFTNIFPSNPSSRSRDNQPVRGEISI